MFQTRRRWTSAVQAAVLMELEMAAAVRARAAAALAALVVAKAVLAPLVVAVVARVVRSRAESKLHCRRCPDAC